MRALAVAGGAPDIGAVHPTALTTLAGFLGAAMGALGLWLANRLLGKAAFQTAINDGFAKLTADLQEERADLRRELDDARLHWAGERASLQGEIRNLNQTIESLKAWFRRNGVPIPEPTIAGGAPDPGAVILDAPKKGR